MPLPGIRAQKLVTIIPMSLLLLSLAACSGASAPEQNSTDQASSGSPQNKCQVATESINEVVEGAQQRIPELIMSGSFDPADLVDPILESLDAARADATDSATVAAISDARAEWDGLVTDFQGLTAPDVNNLDALSKLGALKTYGEDLSAIATKRLPALKETGSKLQEACSSQ